MKIPTVLIIGTGLLTSALVTTLAFAHVNATGIVKERMDAMVIVGKANKALSAMFKGEVEYDPLKVEEAALLINEHAGEAITKLFPEGSGGMPSEALPAIWEDWASFVAIADDLATYSQALAAAAENPRGMMQDGQGMMGGSQGMMGQSSGNAGMGMMSAGPPDAAMLASMPPDGIYLMVSQTCSSCHTKFRLEKK